MSPNLLTLLPLLIFVLVLVVFVLISVILVYHWRRYGRGNVLLLSFESVYFIIAAIIIINAVAYLIKLLS